MNDFTDGKGPGTDNGDALIEEFFREVAYHLGGLDSFAKRFKKRLAALGEHVPSDATECRLRLEMARNVLRAGSPRRRRREKRRGSTNATGAAEVTEHGQRKKAKRTPMRVAATSRRRESNDD